MPARNSAKAILYHNDRILLNRCSSKFGEYYALPGGGQKTGELLTETLVRELKEETGLTVEPVRLAAVYERITANREDGDNHKLYFIFLCRLMNVKALKPTELDAFQIDQQWIPSSHITSVNLFPRAVRDNINRLIAIDETIYLGSERKK